MRKLFLHIGIEKTGSTSIQNTLSKERSLLKKNGIDYPSCFRYANHVELTCITQKYDQKSELYSVVGFGVDEQSVENSKVVFKDKLKEYVLSSDSSVFIFSNEHLHSRVRDPGEISELSEFLYEIFDDITIVIYLREQLELAVSHYSTQIKSGSTSEFELPDTKTNIPHYYDFEKIIDMWSVFDDMVIREFDRKELKNQDVVSDFCSIFSEDFFDIKSLPSTNESLDVASLSLLRMINKNTPLIVDGKVNPKRFRLVSFLEAISSNDGLLVSSSEAFQFRNTFSQINKDISYKYSLRDDFLRKKSKVGELTEPDISKALSNLWEKVSAHISFLEINNAKLRAKLLIDAGKHREAEAFLASLKSSGLPIDTDFVMNEILNKRI